MSLISEQHKEVFNMDDSLISHNSEENSTWENENKYKTENKFKKNSFSFELFLSTSMIS